jgi:hypothetical protein
LRLFRSREGRERRGKGGGSSDQGNQKIKMVATRSSSSSSSTTNKNTIDGKKDNGGKKGREMVASKAEVSGEKKLFTKSVRTPCTMAMFKKFYESATPVMTEEAENNTLKLVGPTQSTGSAIFLAAVNTISLILCFFQKRLC